MPALDQIAQALLEHLELAVARDLVQRANVVVEVIALPLQLIAALRIAIEPDQALAFPIERRARVGLAIRSSSSSSATSLKASLATASSSTCQISVIKSRRRSRLGSVNRTSKTKAENKGPR